jgi:aspartate carbamoyltransferase catalytic subunit
MPARWLPYPIINAGDGAHMHPSQCLLDLYSIYKTQGTLENLNIYLVGDLKYGRTVHSLIMAMRHFNPTFHFIAPKGTGYAATNTNSTAKSTTSNIRSTLLFNEKVIADADISI